MILLTHSLHDFKLKTSSEKSCLTRDMVFCTVSRRKKKNHILQSLEMKRVKNVHLVDCENIKCRLAQFFFVLGAFFKLLSATPCWLFIVFGGRTFNSILYFRLILYRCGKSHNFSIQERVQSICQDAIYLNNIEYN